MCVFVCVCVRVFACVCVCEIENCHLKTQRKKRFHPQSATTNMYSRPFFFFSDSHFSNFNPFNHTHTCTLSLTHTQTHTLSLSHTHAHTLSLSHPHSLSRTRKIKHTQTYTYTNAHIHTRTHTHTHTCTHSHIHTLSLTHTLTRTRTRKITHVPNCFQFDLVGFIFCILFFVEGMRKEKSFVKKVWRNLEH